MKHKPKNITKGDWDAVESPPLSDEMLSRMKPVRSGHTGIPARLRGPQNTSVKVPISIRLSPDVIGFFKSQGRGWQTKINNVLHEYIRSHD